jgi:hypothetical protein
MARAPTREKRPPRATTAFETRARGSPHAHGRGRATAAHSPHAFAYNAHSVPPPCTACVSLSPPPRTSHTLWAGELLAVEDRDSPAHVTKAKTPNSYSGSYRILVLVRVRPRY